MYRMEGPQVARPVEFTGDKEEELRNYLQEEHTDILNQRQSLEKKWKLWGQQANTRRKRQGAKSRDCQTDMPMTRVRISQASSRVAGPIFQQDPTMIARPRKSGAEDLALALEPVLNFIVDRADMEEMVDGWAEDGFLVYPSGIVKTDWITEIRYVKKWEEIDVDEYEMRDEAGEKVVKRELTDGNVKFFVEVEKEHIERIGCFPEVIPIEDFIVHLWAQDVESAPLVTHRLWKTRAQIAACIRKGTYRDKTPDGDSLLDALGKPEATRKPIYDVYDREEPKSKQFEIMETHLAWDADGDGEEEDIIVLWERESGLILRCDYAYYQNYHRPFVVHKYRSQGKSIYGVPLTFDLEPLHVANSASFQQRLDAASKANERLLFVPPGNEALKAMNQDGMAGGVYEYLGSKDEIFEAGLSQPWNQLPELEDKLNEYADQVSHLSPSSYGLMQESRPTAFGQQQQQEQTQIPQFKQVDRFRKSFALVVRHMLSRYQQFYPEGLHYFLPTLGEEELMVEQVFSWPDEVLEEEVIMETKVSSATMSKMMRQQQRIALMDKIPQIYQVMTGLGQMVAQSGTPQPGAVIMGDIAEKLLAGFQLVVDDFLAEFEVANRDEINPDLVQEGQVAQMAQQQISHLRQQLQQSGQQAQRLAAENAQLKGAPPPGMGGQPQPAPGIPGPRPMGPGPGGPMPGQAPQ